MRRPVMRIGLPTFTPVVLEMIDDVLLQNGVVLELPPAGHAAGRDNPTSQQIVSRVQRTPWPPPTELATEAPRTSS